MAPPNKAMMTPEFVHEQLGKVEVQVSELRSAVTNTQISLGKIDALTEMIAQFTARHELMADRNEKSLTRIHDRIDQVQKEVSAEVELMRREVRDMHDTHRESVSDQIKSSLIGLTAQVQTLDVRSMQTKEGLDTWRAEVRGMTTMAKILWTVMGSGIIALGVGLIRLYFTVGA